MLVKALGLILKEYEDLKQQKLTISTEDYVRSLITLKFDIEELLIDVNEHSNNCCEKRSLI